MKWGSGNLCHGAWEAATSEWLLYGLLPNQLDARPPGAMLLWARRIGPTPKHKRVAGKYINKNPIKITKVLTLFILHAKIISTNSLTRGYEWQNLRSVISIEP